MEQVIGSDLEVGDAGIDGIVEQAERLVPELASLERSLLERTGRSSSEASASDGGGDSSTAMGKTHVVCLARLLFGACCEAYAILKCHRICRRGYRPHSAGSCKRMARVYKDSCHAAVWTSAHANFVHDIIHYGITACYPGVYTVPSELSEVDLSELYSHRWNASVSNASDPSSMLSLMTRCTNPGSRGWDGILVGMIEENLGTKRVCANAMAVSITGMHSCIHPAERLHWKHRLGLILFLSHGGLVSNVASLCGHPTAFKELMRRFVSNATSSSYASNAALLHLEHPVSLLYGCPSTLPPGGLECSCNAFAEVGRMIVDSRGACVIRSLVDAAFRSLSSPASPGDATTVQGAAKLQWNHGYLGKGTASIHHKVPATSMGSSIWAMAFRCNFIPFWSHSATKNVRAARLDACQHAAIHTLNSATQLTLLLSEAERMKIHRLALSNACAGIMNLEEVASLLGVADVKGSSCNGGAKGAMDAVRTLADAGSQGAAYIMSFCRIAMISEELLIYDLGERTKELQVKALLKRVLADECFECLEGSAEELLAYVPEHSKHLCACVECKRVTNAVACDGGTNWNKSFTELGTSASMASIDSTDGSLLLRCAKRASASLKAAVSCEETVMNNQVESMEVNRDALTPMLCNAGVGMASGISARVRRDSKSALEQRASSTACGHENMLSIPLVGRALRLWGEWYALCSFCGSCTRFYPYNRYHAHICCMRCDFKMLNRQSDTVTPHTERETTHAPVCRYCNRVDPQRAGARWRLVKSPLDKSGRNASLPPPLRCVYFCPKHFRSWIPACMKTMETRIILSHIVYGARPFFDVRDEDRPAEEEQVRAAAEKKRKRKQPKLRN